MLSKKPVHVSFLRAKKKRKAANVVSATHDPDNFFTGKVYDRIQNNDLMVENNIFDSEDNDVHVVPMSQPVETIEKPAETTPKKRQRGTEVTPSPVVKTPNVSTVSEALNLPANNIRTDRVFHDRVADVRTNLVLDLANKESKSAWLALQDADSFAINFLWDAYKAKMTLEKSIEGLLEMFKGE